MKRPGPTLRVLLRETGSTLDIWLVPYMWLAGVSLSYFSDMAFATEGPEQGIQSDNYLINVVVEVRMLETVLSRKP